MKEQRIALISLARVNFDMEMASSLTQFFTAHLIKDGFQITGSSHPVTNLEELDIVVKQLSRETFDLLLIFQATFADSSMVTHLADSFDQPLFLWAVPEAPNGGRLRLNALCGINLATHALTLRQRRYDYAYAPPEDIHATERLKRAAAAAKVVRRLRSARVGIVGEHPDGMDTCQLDEAVLNRLCGLQVIQFPQEIVFERMLQVNPSITGRIQSELNNRITGLDELDQSPLHRTLAAYHVLEQLAEDEALDGLAVRCWPEFFTELKCAACGALSLLNDQYLPAGCEADINGTVTQLILQWLSNEPAFGTDIVSMDEATNTTVLWHCGQAPLSMADPAFKPRGTIHSNRRLPLLMEFPLKPGRVTLARLSRAGGELKMVIGGGEMLSAPLSFSGTSGVIRFDRHVCQVLDTLLGEGLEHHLALTYGDHLDELFALAKMLELPVVSL